MKEFEIKLILDLQKALRSPFLDWVIYIFSYIGSEYFFLAIAVIVYWCISKKFGFRFMNIFFAGQLFVGVIKTAVRRPRPFESGAAAVIGKTDGYSFPSGHSHNIANISTQLTLGLDKTVIKDEKTVLNPIRLYAAGIGAVVTVLVMFSRMYLGQHFLSDVVFGAALGVFVAATFGWAYGFLGQKEERIAFVVLPASIVLAAVLIGIDKNFGDAIKIAGVYGAATLGYFLEKRYIKYNEKSGKLYRQIIKVVMGVAIIIIIKEGISVLSSVLEISGRLLMFVDYLRYFLVGIFATLGAPFLFRVLEV